MSVKRRDSTRPTGARYRNLYARGGVIYYQRRIGGRRVRRSCGTDDWERAVARRDLWEQQQGLSTGRCGVKPAGPRYRNLYRRGRIIYYERIVGGERTKFSTDTVDWDEAASVRDLWEDRKGISAYAFDGSRQAGGAYDDRCAPTGRLKDKYRKRSFRRSSPLRRVAARLGGGVSGVYVIRCSRRSLYKIGKTKDLRGRLRSHASSLPDAMPGKIYLAQFIPCDEALLGFVEGILHWAFREWRIGRVEIFDVRGRGTRPDEIRTTEDVIEVASGLARVAS